jgi:ribonuclease BN (tRNA processing enzyme)
MLEKGVDRLVARTGNGARLKEHLLASHTFASDAARIAVEAGAGHLVLNHLIPADDPEVTEADWIDAVRAVWDGRLTIGRDGLAVPLE